MSELAQILDKLTAIEKRLSDLERVAHPQSVMADPSLTRAIKEIFNERQTAMDARPTPRFCAKNIRLC